MNALDNEFVINKCDGEVFRFSENVTIVVAIGRKHTMIVQKENQ